MKYFLVALLLFSYSIAVLIFLAPVKEKWVEIPYLGSVSSEEFWDDANLPTIQEIEAGLQGIVFQVLVSFNTANHKVSVCLFDLRNKVQGKSIQDLADR